MSRSRYRPNPRTAAARPHRRARWDALPVGPKRLALALALVGCNGGDDDLVPSPAEPVLGADTVVGVAVDDAVGPVPLTTWARAVNAYGAAVPSAPSTLQIDGAPVDVSFDGTGYARVVRAEPGSAAVSGALEPATIHAVASDWPGFGANPAKGAPLADAERAVAVTTGSVVGKGTELWWVGPEGRAHRVLNADGAIQGLRAAHVDVDDVLDVVAWTEYTVFLLRGRTNGGMSWGAGFTAPAYTVGGADVGDLDGDNLPDLAIAWASVGGTSVLDVWNGDGLFTFSAAEPRDLPELPMDLSIGDNTGEGRNQVSVIDVEGDWNRYIAGTETQYIPIGPKTPDEIVIPVGSTFDAAGDVNGDGADELWLYGAYNPGSPRQTYLVDLKGQRLEFVPYQPAAAHVARADGDGNEVIELFTAEEDGTLRSLSFDLATTSTYVPRNLEDLPEVAPIALNDWLDDDGIADLFLAGSAVWRWWRGLNDPLDPDLFWTRRDPLMGEVATSIGPLAQADLDDDPVTTELVTFEPDGGQTRLVIHQWTAGDTAVTRRGTVIVSSVGAAPLDVAICDGFGWVVTAGELARVSFANLGAPTITKTISTLGTRVDCGAAPDGAVAALLSDGVVQLLDANLVEVGTVSAPNARDLAVGDAGAGPEVATCDTADCAVILWPWGAAGEASFARSEGEQIVVEGGAGPFAGGGDLSVADVDDDGNLDLLAARPDGVVTLVRSTGAAVAVAEHVHTLTGALGPAVVGDADGDGWRDLWLVGADDILRHTITPVPPPVEPEGDTGFPDTGP